MPEYTEEDIKLLSASTSFTMEQIIKAIKFYENERVRWNKNSTERYYKLHPTAEKREKKEKKQKEDALKRPRGRPRKNPSESFPAQNEPEITPA